MAKEFSIKTDIYVKIWVNGKNHLIQSNNINITEYGVQSTIQDTKGALSKYVEQTLRMECEWRNIEIPEMNVEEDHIYKILSIPLKIITIPSNWNAKRDIKTKGSWILIFTERYAQVANFYRTAVYRTVHTVVEMTVNELILHFLFDFCENVD